MNQTSKPLDTSIPARAVANFGRAVDEIRLRRSLDKLIVLINSFEPSKRPQYLVDEIASQQKKLDELRALRNR